MQNIKAELLLIFNTVVQFLKKPMEEIKHLPDWSWQRLMITQIATTVVVGTVIGLFARGRSIIFSAVSMTILTLILSAIATAFFFYAFQVFAERKIPVKNIFAVVLFASIPMFLMQILAEYFQLITLVGLGFTALLMTVGFVENFQLPRQLVIKLISAVSLVFLVIVLTSYRGSSSSDSKWDRSIEEAPEVHLGE